MGYNSIFVVTDKNGTLVSQAYATLDDCVKHCLFNALPEVYEQLPFDKGYTGSRCTGVAYMDRQTREVYYIEELNIFGRFRDIHKSYPEEAYLSEREAILDE